MSKGELRKRPERIAPMKRITETKSVSEDLRLEAVFHAINAFLSQSIITLATIKMHAPPNTNQPIFSSILNVNIYTKLWLFLFLDKTLGYVISTQTPLVKKWNDRSNNWLKVIYFDFSYLDGNII